MTTKYMDIKEFYNTGYVHEINRRVLHPLGLALEINEVEDTTLGNYYVITGIQDWREDPEGVSFSKLNTEKIERIHAEEMKRFPARVAALGYDIQGDDDPPAIARWSELMRVLEPAFEKYDETREQQASNEEDSPT